MWVCCCCCCCFHSGILSIFMLVYNSCMRIFLILDLCSFSNIPRLKVQKIQSWYIQNDGHLHIWLQNKSTMSYVVPISPPPPPPPPNSRGSAQAKRCLEIPTKASPQWQSMFFFARLKNTWKCGLWYIESFAWCSKSQCNEDTLTIILRSLENYTRHPKLRNINLLNVTPLISRNPREWMFSV